MILHLLQVTRMGRCRAVPERDRVVPSSCCSRISRPDMGGAAGLDETETVYRFQR